VATQTSGTILYRVVLGPYGSEAEAERAGKQSGRDYWVYEGEP
jgi:cell division protein FtsN